MAPPAVEVRSAVGEGLRVVHLDCGRSWRGGQRQVLLLLQGLRALGLTTHLLCPPGAPLSLRAAQAGLSPVAWSARGEWDPAALWRLCSHLRALAPDLVHAHDPTSHGLLCLARRLDPRLRDIPAVVHRRVDFSVGRGPWSRWKYHDPGLGWLVVSGKVAAVLEEGGVPPERIRVLPSAVEAPRPQRSPADVRRGLGLLAEERLLLAVGALAPHKGHGDLIDALSLAGPAARGWCLAIAGEGRERARLEARVRRARVRVLLLGHRDDIDDLIGSCDMFVHPSREEGLGTVVLEALALGRPIVATAAGGVPEMLGGGAPWPLTPPGDVAALSRVLVTALTAPAAAPAEPPPASRWWTPAALAAATVDSYLSLVSEAETGRARNAQ